MLFPSMIRFKPMTSDNLLEGVLTAANVQRILCLLELPSFFHRLWRFEYFAAVRYSFTGDCTCESPYSSWSSCGSFACIDPSAICVDDDSVTADMVDLGCGTGIGDGYCNMNNNIPECGGCSLS